MRLEHTVGRETREEHIKLIWRYTRIKTIYPFLVLLALILFIFYIYWGWPGNAVIFKFFTKYFVGLLVIMSLIGVSFVLLHRYLCQWRKFVPMDLTIYKDGIRWRSLSGMHTVSFGQLKGCNVISYMGSRTVKFNVAERIEEFLHDFTPFFLLDKHQVHFRVPSGNREVPLVFLTGRISPETIKERVDELTEKYLNYIINVRPKERIKELKRLEV